MIKVCQEYLHFIQYANNYHPEFHQVSALMANCKCFISFCYSRYGHMQHNAVNEPTIAALSGKKPSKISWNRIRHSIQGVKTYWNFNVLCVTHHSLCSNNIRQTNVSLNEIYIIKMDRTANTQFPTQISKGWNLMLLQQPISITRCQKGIDAIVICYRRRRCLRASHFFSFLRNH